MEEKKSSGLLVILQLGAKANLLGCHTSPKPSENSDGWRYTSFYRAISILCSLSDLPVDTLAVKHLDLLSVCGSDSSFLVKWPSKVICQHTTTQHTQ